MGLVSRKYGRPLQIIMSWVSAKCKKDYLLEGDRFVHSAFLRTTRRERLFEYVGPRPSLCAIQILRRRAPSLKFVDWRLCRKRYATGG